MAISAKRRWSRRSFLLTGLAALLPRLGHAVTAEVRLAASWSGTDPSGAPYYQVGILTPDVTGWRVAAACTIPTRAHGLLQASDGSLLAVARRPGHWLLRWNRRGEALAWRWHEPNRTFNGHILADAAGTCYYTTETDTETGRGLIGVRAAHTLEKLEEWPTGGLDPHQLLEDRRQPGCLLVANGGIAQRPETGRSKHTLEYMDSSLVRLRAGKRVGQWRLPDQRLSLRHLSWNRSGLLGIALQAEHADAQARLRAPVLALFDGQDLHAVASAQPCAGYGGDITSLGDEFVVSCPRQQGLARFDGSGHWSGWENLTGACALASDTRQVWAGGQAQLLVLAPPRQPRLAWPLAQTLHLDNHWLKL